MAVVFRIDVAGMAQVRTALTRLGTAGRFALTKVLNEEAEAIIGEAKLETPVDTGALQGSGVVLPPTGEFMAVTIEAGFGGPAAPYALRVHEDLAIPHTPPGKAKYLEDPFNRALVDFEPRVAAKLRIPGVT